MIGFNLFDPFIYCILSSSVLLILGIPAVIICFSILIMDIKLETYFFNDLEGGNLVRYIHLF